LMLTLHHYYGENKGSIVVVDNITKSHTSKIITHLDNNIFNNSSHNK